MTLEHRPVIQERNGDLIVEHEMGGDISGDDCAERAGGGHGRPDYPPATEVEGERALASGSSLLTGRKRGIRTVNVVPASGSLAASMVPPCASTTVFAIASPS